MGVSWTPSKTGLKQEWDSLTRHNLSICRGSEFSIESADIFSNVLFRPLQCIFGFITIYQSINIKFFELPQCFTVRIILRFYAILPVFVLYSHYGNSILCKRPNGTRLLNLIAS